MLTDIEIAQQATLYPISKIASLLNIAPDDIESYGHFKAKISMAPQNNPQGKLVLVSAMNPTPAGEGKTTVSIGLSQAMNQLGRKAVLALREPSLGPVFGVKGGAAGGGYSQVLPMEDLNLHFTGDLHAVTSANNLLAAIIDNHLYQGNTLRIDKERVLWKRCMDMNDRVLRRIHVGMGAKTNGVPRDDIFSITAASEVMAILCLATDLSDLKLRLSRIVVAYNEDGDFVTAHDLHAEGAMTALLKDAMKPNLIQTIEHTPAFIHGGPFANISHGCNSLMATRLAMQTGEIAVTEAGFGADLGAEKFLNIVCRLGGIWPDAVVLVSTLRSLKYNAGIPKENLTIPNPEAVRIGFANLQKHIQNIQAFGLPCVVAANCFPSDTDEEMQILRELCVAEGARFSATQIFAKGGKGGLELASEVLSILDENRPGNPCHTYSLEDTVCDKITALATKIYGASGVEFSPEALEKIAAFEKMGFDTLPICMAKTQYSLSDDAKCLGRPENFSLTVRDVWLSAGAGYLVVLTGSILTMPGLPPKPAAEQIDVDPSGHITGLF